MRHWCFSTVDEQLEARRRGEFNTQIAVMLEAVHAGLGARTWAGKEHTVKTERSPAKTTPAKGGDAPAAYPPGGEWGAMTLGRDEVGAMESNLVFV